MSWAAQKTKHLEENLLADFLFLDSDIFIGYRTEKTQKTRRKPERKQNVGGNVVPKDFQCFSLQWATTMHELAAGSTDKEDRHGKG